MSGSGRWCSTSGCGPPPGPPPMPISACPSGRPSTSPAWRTPLSRPPLPLPPGWPPTTLPVWPRVSCVSTGLIPCRYRRTSAACAARSRAGCRGCGSKTFCSTSTGAAASPAPSDRLPATSPRAQDTYRALLATLIAHGTNLGLTAMGDSVETLTAADLQQTSRWLVRDGTLKAANAQIVEHLHQLDFAVLWGDGRLSSSDGQRFRAPPGTLIGAYHPRYFGHYDKAVTVYTHVSDRIGVFATQVISCAPREATYVLDGLLDNDTSLDPRLHTTDTHGFTEALWGLCHLLGINFMPRLKDLADQRLWRPEGASLPAVLTTLFAGTIDTAIIAEQWDQLVRIAASLKARTAPAHVVLQRLTAGGPSDRVAKVHMITNLASRFHQSGHR